MIFLETTNKSLTESDLLSNLNDLINHLYDHISNLQGIYLTVFSIVMSLFALAIGFLDWKQKKYSDREINDIRKEFKIDELQNAIQDSKKEREKSKKDFLQMKQYNYELLLTLSTSNLESVNSNTTKLNFSNMLTTIISILNKIEFDSDITIEEHAFKSGTIHIVVGLKGLNDLDFNGINADDPKDVHDKTIQNLNYIYDTFEKSISDKNFDPLIQMKQMINNIK